MKDNLIVCVSSHNNYDMLEGEVLKNIDFEGFEFINIDDNSNLEEIQKGRDICSKHKISFIENKSKGVQHAVHTLMEFIKIERPKCKWVVIFQHDNYPITKNFFNRLSNLIEQNNLNDISVLGFNNLDPGDYTGNSFNEWGEGNKPLGILGKFHLSVVDNSQRWAAPLKNEVIKNNYSKNFSTPFSIEIPLETCMAIKVEDWLNFIQPTTDYQFHLWFPDIMMQFLYNNKHCVILPDLYCYNHQELKMKYGIAKSSAKGAIQGQVDLFGEYGPHLTNFQNRWGWDYENTRKNFPIESYRNTLIEEFYNHDLNNMKKPLKSFDLKY